MTAVKSSSANDAVSVNAAVAGDLRDRKTMKVLREIETDLESNASSSEDMEYYSPKSVVAKKWPANKEVNVSGVRFLDQVMRIRAEDLQIGEDIGEFCIRKFGSNNNGGRVDVMICPRRPSPLSGKVSSINSEH